ncbi:MAG: hypothetical protein E6G21_09715 [Actinobacteria bacterium]|nr:MAG: hypothetical protein E6G21_09715 [Actinomycetota bacterium]
MRRRPCKRVWPPWWRSTRCVRPRRTPRAVGAGEYVGLLEDEPVTGGAEFEPVARALLERLLAEPREVVTLLTGEDEPDLSELLAELERANPEVEIEVHEGGQQNYPLLVSAE